MARKRRTPRRGAGGRFMKASRVRAASNPRRRRRSVVRASSPRRRTYRRRNAYLMNPRTRRRTYKRRYRRNPPLFGGNRIMGLSVTELLYAGGGFVAPPLIEGALSTVLPDALKTSQIGKYVTKGAIVAGLSMLGNKFLGREAGKYLAIGGATYLIANLIVEFAPQLFSGFGATTLLPGPTIRMPLRGQIGLGMGAYLGAGNGASQTEVPDRLSAASRF